MRCQSVFQHDPGCFGGGEQDRWGVEEDTTSRREMVQLVGEGAGSYPDHYEHCAGWAGGCHVEVTI